MEMKGWGIIDRLTGKDKEAEFQEEMAGLQFKNLITGYKSENPEKLSEEFRARCEEAREHMTAAEYVAWLHGFQDGMGTGVIVAMGREAFDIACDIADAAYTGGN